MKKRIILPGILTVIGFFALTTTLRGSSHFPENAYSPEYVLAADEPSPTKPVALATTFINVPLDTIPLEPRNGDFLTTPSSNPFDLKDPKDVQQTVEYDPISGQYIITERLGDDYYRPPTYLTFDEYMEFQAKKQEQDYFKELNGSGQRGVNGKLDPIGKIDVKNQLIERLFGGTKVDIQPQGNIDLTFGVDFSNVQNPSWTKRQQRRGGFDFDMDIQMNVEGSIGEKLKLSTNYNTQATFDFDNTMKLDYNTDAFGEDDIIKKIEAGNVSLPLKSTLIQGSQSLFGLKTELQFAKLRLALVASQQRSQQDDVTLKGGSQFQEYEVFADAYDENRHFLLTHYNRNNFEYALSDLPAIKSLFKIQKIQVWVTDSRGSTENIRDIVAIADLGETERMTNTSVDMQPPPSPVNPDNKGEGLPDNYANPIYGTLLSNPSSKQVERIVNVLKTPPFNFQQGRDFEKVTARLLSPTEYTFHPELGFVSLNLNIQPDQVVGIAFEYTYKDKLYQVGQMAEDVAQNSGLNAQSDPNAAPNQNVLFVKMLKSTVQPVNLPTWDLMMKNVYNIGAYNVSREDFKLDIYYDDPGQGSKRFLPSSNLAGIPLLRVFNLDQLNVQNDPQPDGVFDYVDGLTIQSRSGRIMFPVLEPFGDALEKQITDPVEAKKYVFKQLYTQTLFNAREYPELNRFTIKGTYKSSVSSEISLGAFNIPPGSVTVTAGGATLLEGKDYEVDYSIGKVRILNDAILNSGTPIKVSFEDNTLFGFQTKSMLGVRADYEVNKHLTIGGTYLRLFERPYTQKVNIGDDPINNRMFGLDINYSNEVPWITKMVDKLPFISTKAPSNVTLSAETAAIKPGHARAINEKTADGDKGGVTYIDDFEGSAQPINIQSPFNGTNGWVMSSIPQNDMFPESGLKDDILAGVNRAHLSWFRIESGSDIRGGTDATNPYTQNISQQEIFPNFTPTNQFGNSFNQILDVMYDPTRRGPYNYDLPGGTAFSAGLNNTTANLLEPESRWAGMMRQLTTNDFQTANIEYIEFWMLSPYLDETGADAGNPAAVNGDMDGYVYFNLGNISEDIIPDSRKFFENGLPGPNTQGRRAATTGWGRVPLTQQITNSFDTDTENRAAQDVGLDGLSSAMEKDHYQAYVNAINASGITADIKQAIMDDPSNDDFVHFRYGYPSGTPLLERYDRFFGTEGNTPILQGQQTSPASTLLPDSEDLDGDRTLNETEGYFQYRVPIKYDGNKGIDLDNPFITDVTTGANNRVWYRFRVPLDLPATDPNFKKIGGIEDFRSIRFMRMYFKDFKAPVQFRFATLDLQRNQWRRYKQDIGEPCLSVTSPDFENQTLFELNKVNIEENSQRDPFNYVLPPGISREQALGVNLQAFQNEQALTMRVCDLADGDARGMFKNLNLDMRYYSKLKMFVHAEPTDCGIGPEPLQNGDLKVFVRLGSDFKNNFYEYEIPLILSDPNSGVPENDPDYQRVVWPQENDLSVVFDELKKLKLERNASSTGAGQIYSQIIERDNGLGDARISIKGAPNLGNVKALMIGIRNAKQGDDCDPGDTKSVEIWVNELRTFGLDERGGVAATARADIQLADLGTLSLSGKASSIGFGALDQKLQERSREQITQYDIATQLSLDKFLPERIGLRLPFYFQYSSEVRNPQFDPYDRDIEVKDKLKLSDNPDSIRQLVQTATKIKSYNFTNVRWENPNASGKVMPWSLSNFSFTYGFDETSRRDPIIESDVLTRRRGAVDYRYQRSVKYIEPFKKAIKNDKYLKFIKEVNFNPLPNSFSFSTDLDRRFNSTKYRFSGDNAAYNTYYNKQFLWNRRYDFAWDFTKNLKFKFNADNIGVIDEPDEADMRIRHQLDPNDPNYISNVKDYRREAIYENMRDFGRTKSYKHQYSVTYNVPIKVLPFMDWTSLKLSYDADYSWDAASLATNAQALGNVITNGQRRQVEGDLDFEKLYNYSNYLKKINSKRRPAPGGRTKGGKDDVGGKDAQGDEKLSRKERRAKDAAAAAKDKNGKDDKKKDREPSTLERALIRPLMTVRKLKVRYTENYGTVIPGYLPQSKLLGMNQFTSPGWDFVAGKQPNINPDDYYTNKDWLHKNWEWITPDLEYALPKNVTQSYEQVIDGKLDLEPYTDFRVTVEAKRSKGRNHSEEFRRYDDFGGDPVQGEFRHANITDFGQFNTSYSALNTLFSKDLQGLFQQFEDNKLIVANRLGNGVHDNIDSAYLNYPKGYGPFSQNVLLPAFIAAYTGEDANTMKVSNNYVGDVIIKTIPRPNWRLTYNGLAKLGNLSDVFQTISITHGYQGKLVVNSFDTDRQYDRTDPGKLKETTLDYYSRFEVPDIQIDEQFSPLLGIDVRLKNGMSFKTEYKNSRQLRLELIGTGRLRETKAEEYTVNFGYKLKDTKLSFFTPKKKKKSSKKNDKKPTIGRPGQRASQNTPGDMDFSFDLSVRDDVTNIRELITGLVEPDRGSRRVTFSPAITYQLNDQLSLRFFFDYSKNTPKTSAGYPTTNIRSGVTVRFSL
ncbi:MAG: cell surface protein SprA [Saprospiraceae bacterium]|nr:cell surface protein SprA [Saprospiraceae bacterium]MCF8250982.1 cell surface protein SprA [Saprospiraceae bacterium]MCF8280311.1 cell surface protein SprA [Bacteroidales bacterium]MCF8312838.1 cell surface protein SprA [Saprospiraceae bacterium]MCF8441285.1 cell surface protein SprA [Saprospiraceae bacterium]